MIDAPILDKVFQPVADFAARWVSCLRIGQAFLWAAAVALLVYAVVNPYFILAAVVGLFGTTVPGSWLIGKEIKRAKSGSMTLSRLPFVLAPHRYIFVVAITLSSFLSGFRPYAINGIFSLWALGFYMASCRTRPPGWRQTKRKSAWFGNLVGAH